MVFSGNGRPSRRRVVRLVSFGAALVLALTGGWISAACRGNQYRTQLEYTYERGLSELSEHLNQMEIALTKGLYTGTANGAANLAVQLWNSAGCAKSCLSQIPTYGTDLENTYKFLSQVGEFSLSLAKKMQNGGKVTGEEYAQLQQLSKSATAFSQKVSALCDEMNRNGQWKRHIVETIEKGNTHTAAAPLYTNLNELDDIVSDTPTLLYDGPFSEHILQAKPLYLVNKPIVKESQARSIATQALNISDNAITDATTVEHSAVDCYVYNTANASVSVTKHGGVVNDFHIYRDTSEPTLSYDQCIEQAKAYLISLDLGTFKESYYSVSEGICLINFAYYENDTIFYTDLIKVGVAMDDGQIVNYNAQGFVMNHHKRNLPQPIHTKEEAQAVLSPYLTVENTALAVIPSNSRTPLLCYEFLCKAQEGKEILVYVNVETLAEEQLLILLKTDGGTLTI